MANIVDRNRPEQAELKPVEYEGMGRPDDSRLKGFGNVRITHPTLPLERTFCGKCGAPYGWVSVESADYIRAGEVFVFCEKCEEDMRTKLGPIPLAVAAPKEATEIPALRKGSLPSKLGE